MVSWVVFVWYVTACHEVFGCGVFAGLCYCGMYPVESAKTRVQLMNDKVGFFRAFYNILKTEGTHFPLPLHLSIKY